MKDATDWWRIEGSDKENQPERSPAFPHYAAAEKPGRGTTAGPDCPEFAASRALVRLTSLGDGAYRRWEMGYRRQQGGFGTTERRSVDHLRVHDPDRRVGE